MVRLLLIILFSLFNVKAYSFSIVQQASHCDEMSKKIESKLLIDKEYNYTPHVINRTKRKDIIFETIDFEAPQYSGINIKFKNNLYPICFEALTVPTAILIEEKELYDAFDRRMEKHLYFSIHALVNCGTPCTHSHVYSVSFYKDGKVSDNELKDYLSDTMTYFAHRYYGRDQKVQIHNGG